MLATFLGIPTGSEDWFTEFRLLVNPLWWLYRFVTPFWDAMWCALIPGLGNCQ